MPRAEIDGDVITVETRWTEKEQIASVPGSRWDADQKLWTVPLTWGACLTLRGVFGDDLTVGSELALWSQAEVRDRVGPALALRSVITRVPGDWDQKLHDFQTAGSAFLIAAGEGALLADDMGLGKTAQVLAVIRALTRLEPADALPALVICPNNVKLSWQRQVEKWDTPTTPYVVTGSAAQRKKIIEAARRDPAALVIINVEAVRLLARLAPYGSTRLKRCRECDRKHGEENLTPSRCEVHPKPLNGFGFHTVVLDEAHMIKDPASKQTRACWSVGHDPSVRRRWATTGTPIANHLGDLWSIMHFLVPREYPVKSKFVDRHALQAWNVYGGLDIVGVNPATRAELYGFLDPRFRRTPKALVLDQLPDVVRSTRWVDMVPKQAAAYRELTKTGFTVMDDGQLMISPNNLVNATRRLQLASSYAEVEWVLNPLKCPHHPSLGPPETLECCKTHRELIVKLCEPSPKLDAVETDIEALEGRRVVVAAQSRQLIELLARRLTKKKFRFGLITGAVDVYDQRATIDRFERDQIRAVLMTIGAGGTGTDGLQCADTLLVIQRSWSMLQNVQLDARVHRIGSEVHDSVHIVEYVTRDTLEETTLFPRLAEKWERLEEINRDRARLTQAGITPERLFELDAEESQLTNSFLGVP